MVELKSERFVLRSWRVGDEEALSKNANHKSVWENMDDGFPHPYTFEDAKKYVKGRLIKSKQKTSFAIIINDKVAGGIGFRPQEGKNKLVAHLGYWLGKDFWGKGIMTEAIKLITNYSFKNFDLERLEASVFEWNKGSQRVLEKAGYILMGEKRKVMKNNEMKEQKIYFIEK